MEKRNARWQLNPTICKAVFDRPERPLIDLFASVGNKQLPKYCGWGVDPIALASDAMTISWNKISVLCLPADSHDPQGTGQALEVQSVQAHGEFTPLAAPTLVPTYDVPDVSRAILPSLEEGSDPEPRQSLSAIDDDQDSEPDCMAAFIQSHTETDLSTEAATLAGEATLPATEETHNIHIRKYKG